MKTYRPVVHIPQTKNEILKYMRNASKIQIKRLLHVAVDAKTI
jgi:hypothetical protein